MGSTGRTGRRWTCLGLRPPMVGRQLAEAESMLGCAMPGASLSDTVQHNTWSWTASILFI